jgi:hypothetical protein
VGVTVACWIKPGCANFLWEKQGNMNVDLYGPLCHLTYIRIFLNLNIYLVLSQLMLPTSMVVEWLTFSAHLPILSFYGIQQKFFPLIFNKFQPRIVRPALDKTVLADRFNFKGDTAADQRVMEFTSHMYNICSGTWLWQIHVDVLHHTVLFIAFHCISHSWPMFLSCWFKNC